MNRCQFVEDHQRRYGVKRLCRILGISRSSFYYWRRTAPARAVRQKADAQLAARIRVIHRASDGTYGVPRITAELREDGERVNHKRVARVMKAVGLAGLRLRRKHRTTVPDPAAVKMPDLISRDFTADQVNTKYVGDITYLPLAGGKFRCLATVIDLCSCRMAGWVIADHMRADLVVDALKAAERTRGSLAGAVMHTDHGAQYCSRAFADACRRAGVRHSMGAIGSSADNALAEPFNATCKREILIVALARRACRVGRGDWMAGGCRPGGRAQPSRADGVGLRTAENALGWQGAPVGWWHVAGAVALQMWPGACGAPPVVETCPVGCHGRAGARMEVALPVGPKAALNSPAEGCGVASM
ncbi:IS3 family transposase [Streptomyces sp. NBC_01462]|uniref:IS3 family transposase n=1 Tax=Streptomyces sp. NBC_01462 TaxID=2903876 RepID=UPI002E33A7CA|nr:IS3 family transposase [Streptomyces sp. NBC_01462]